MEIQFSRSGGFAGRATSVDGKVVLSIQGAQVVSQDGYHRDLSGDEAASLQAATDEALKTPARKTSSSFAPAPDGFQYDATVTADDRKPVHLSFASGAAGSADASSLSAWVERETDRIWQHRIAQRQNPSQ